MLWCRFKRTWRRGSCSLSDMRVSAVPLPKNSEPALDGDDDEDEDDDDDDEDEDDDEQVRTCVRACLSVSVYVMMMMMMAVATGASDSVAQVEHAQIKSVVCEWILKI